MALTKRKSNNPKGAGKKNWVLAPKTKIARGLNSGKGNPRKIETPEKLWELFLEYREWSKANPYKVHTYTDRKGKKSYQDKERAVSFLGFEGWLCTNEIVYDLSHYEATSKEDIIRAENGVDYRPIIKKIKKACSFDIVGGAMAGVYNAMISSRLEGLTEKVDTTTNGKDIVAQPPQINVYNNAPKMAGSENEVDQTPIKKKTNEK